MFSGSVLLLTTIAPALVRFLSVLRTFDRALVPFPVLFLPLLATLTAFWRGPGLDGYPAGDSRTRAGPGSPLLQIPIKKGQARSPFTLTGQ